MARLKAPQELVEEACDIIARHHHPRPEETVNFKAVYDADMIVNLEEETKKDSTAAGTLETTMSEKFLTDSGHELARSVLVK